MTFRLAQRPTEGRMIRLANAAVKLRAGASVVRVEKDGGQLLYVCDGDIVRCLTSTGEIHIPDALQGLLLQRYFFK